MCFTEIVPIILSECLFYLVNFKDGDTTIKIKNEWFFSLYYLNQIYCVIFSYIQFTFTQTPECFLSNGTKNMHILGSVPELQSVRFGYVFRRKWPLRGQKKNRFHITYPGNAWLINWCEIHQNRIQNYQISFDLFRD